MVAQNIYAVRDFSRCSEKESLIKFLEAFYSRISEKLISMDEPIDWLIVKSDALESIAFASQHFFEGIFEDALKSRFQKDIKVIRKHSGGMCGTIQTNDVFQWVSKCLKTGNISLNYLNSPDLGDGFIVYHLDMRG